MENKKMIIVVNNNAQVQGLQCKTADFYQGTTSIANHCLSLYGDKADAAHMEQFEKAYAEAVAKAKAEGYEVEVVAQAVETPKVEALSLKVKYTDGHAENVHFVGTTHEAAAALMSPMVEEIQILSGEESKDEYGYRRPLKIYWTDPQQMEEFELYSNVRLQYLQEFYKGQCSNHITSCGLCRI